MKKIKAYLAGKLWEESERERLRKIDSLCKSLKIITYLPYRDGGFARKIKDVKRIFKADITDSLPYCDIIIADLDGLHVGAGTAFELGYAYARRIKMIGIKTDEPAEKALDYLSPMILGSMKIVPNLKELEKELKKFVKKSLL
ncbi:MAG: nucleoside 2-deoxyribosyltransferase [Nanoarchaeota archaeon]